MNTAVQQLQFRLALLDIQQLEDIAVRIEEGASSDVMEVLAQNIDTINERQGIEAEPLDILATESYNKRVEIALEGIGASIGRIWNAIYSSIAGMLTAIKQRWHDSWGTFEARLKDLSETKEALLKLDQNAVFDLSVSDKQALLLCDDKGIFKMADAVKNLEKVNDFFDALAEANSSASDKLEKILKAEVSGTKATENPLTAIGLSFSSVAKLATKKTDKSLEYSFGGKRIIIDLPDGQEVKVMDIENVDLSTGKDVFQTVKSYDKTATVGEAVKMADACIQVLRNNILKSNDIDKLIKSLDKLKETSQQFKVSKPMAILTGAKSAAISGALFALIYGTAMTPLGMLAVAAAASVQSAGAAAVGSSVGIASGSDALGILVAAAIALPLTTSVAAAMNGAGRAIAEHRGEGTLTKEDDIFISKAEREYGKCIRAITASLNESISLGSYIVDIRTYTLDDSVTALTRIARTALKAEVKA